MKMKSILFFAVLGIMKAQSVSIPADTAIVTFHSTQIKNKKIDYLINTTGVLWFDKDISSANIDSKIWDKVYEINLKSMVYLSKIIIPKMK